MKIVNVLKFFIYLSDIRVVVFLYLTYLYFATFVS